MNSPLSPLLSAVGRSWWILLLYGLVALGFGIIAIGWPLSAAMVLAWTLGVMAIVEGVISLFALVSGGSGASRGWLALYAIASLGFGILAVINPLATASVLVLFLAAWLLVAGIYRIVFAIRVRKHIRAVAADSQWRAGGGAGPVVRGQPVCRRGGDHTVDRYRQPAVRAVAGAGGVQAAEAEVRARVRSCWAQRWP